MVNFMEFIYGEYRRRFHFVMFLLKYIILNVKRNTVLLTEWIRKCAVHSILNCEYISIRLISVSVTPKKSESLRI